MKFAVWPVAGDDEQRLVGQRRRFDIVVYFVENRIASHVLKTLTDTPMRSTEMPAPHHAAIVVLNGPSSAGKSTLSRYLCENLGEHHLHVELDVFRNMEPPNYWAVEKPLAQIRVAALCRAINATAATFSRHGQAVIVDYVLSPDAWRYMLEDLVDLPVFIVGVFCSLDVLIDRERIRGDRKIGLAASQHDKIHAGRHYDYVVDTSSTNEIECGQSVLKWLQSEPVPAAFSKMRREFFGDADDAGVCW
ncbi:chloramphenicol phosphotransferase CPT family protein [Burkholderia cepacia]|uniref:chloramphenicol phosphotransferase CPT family protein n=1 Tax=Burkholderia cepacia TaxID=292 RepID=UPI001CF4D774|nr:AAA family ATPase [Burkholderia cepacia]MCA8214414.1 chloramphenicol phosphotransferase CPT family protein [Burkholderia cepacia]